MDASFHRAQGHLAAPLGLRADLKVTDTAVTPVCACVVLRATDTHLLQPCALVGVERGPRRPVAASHADDPRRRSRSRSSPSRGSLLPAVRARRRRPAGSGAGCLEGRGLPALVCVWMCRQSAPPPHGAATAATFKFTRCVCRGTCRGGGARSSTGQPYRSLTDSIVSGHAVASLSALRARNGKFGSRRQHGRLRGRHPRRPRGGGGWPRAALGARPRGRPCAAQPLRWWGHKAVTAGRRGRAPAQDDRERGSRPVLRRRGPQRRR